MNREEQIVFDHLKKYYGENVVFEPKNGPPDFSINSSIAVEVRRLNQSYFKLERPEGLENLSFPLFDAFIEVLKSLNYLYSGKSYWVFIEYKRPLNSNIHQAKKDMELALKDFLNLKDVNFPHEISVNSKITFLVYDSNPSNGKLFSVGGSDDLDAGGWVISEYIKNIRHCIKEKSLKIDNHSDKYREWWLYLVNCMGFGLNDEEAIEVIKNVENTGNFNKVVVLSYDGQYNLATILKE